MLTWHRVTWISTLKFLEIEAIVGGCLRKNKFKRAHMGSIRRKWEEGTYDVRIRMRWAAPNTRLSPCRWNPVFLKGHKKYAHN
jgi:hypothetical protein